MATAFPARTFRAIHAMIDFVMRNEPWMRADVRRTLVLAGAGCIASLVIWHISSPPPALLFGDFNSAYYSAASRLLTKGIGPTWSLTPGEICIDGFVNVPVLAWLFVPFAYLEKTEAAWLFLVLGAAAYLAAFVLLQRLAPRTSARSALPLLFLFLLNGPAIHSLREGNTTHLVLLAIIAALLALQRGRDLLAGVILGACAVIKLPLLLLGGYFVLRRRWMVVAGGAAVVGLTAILSLTLFGAALNAGWYDFCVAPYTGRLVPGFNVQSIDAFLYRMLNGAHHLHYWLLVDPSPTHKALRTLLLIATATGVAVTLWQGLRTTPAARDAGSLDPRMLLELSILIVFSLLASPLSWTHYFLMLLLPWGLHLNGALPGGDDAIARRLMLLGMVLASLPVLFPPRSLGTFSWLLSRTLMLSWFYGAVLTFASLLRLAWVADTVSAPCSPRWRDLIADRARRLASEIYFLAAPPARDILTPSQSLTRGVGLFFILNTLFLGVWLATAAPEGYRETVLDHTRGFFAAESSDDSWTPMAEALDYFENDYVRPGLSTPIYTEIVTRREEKFQYPPLTLFVSAGARSLDALAGVAGLTEVAISWLAVVATIIASAAILQIALRRTMPDTRLDEPTWRLRAAIAVAMALTFYPVVKAFTLGQIQSWINAVVAVSVLAWLRGKRWQVGIGVGLISLIKPHYGILMLWGALRREWSFLAAASAVATVGLLASLHVFGWDNHLDYVKLLAQISRSGEAYYPNQSINGLLNRLMSIADPVSFNNLHWIDGHFPPPTWWIHAATVTTSAVILLLVLLPRDRRGDHNGVLDFCAVLVGCTLASPIAWEHHYGILLPVYAVLLAAFLGNRRRLAWLAASYVLVSNYFPATQLLAPSVLNVLQSYLLAGVLIVLALLLTRAAPDETVS